MGGRKGAVDERLNVAQINIGRAPSGGSKNFNLHEFTYDCLKVLNGFIHFIVNMAKEAILETSTDFYAVPAETESAILSLWRANHINKYDHCEMYTQSKSPFTWDFNSTKALLQSDDVPLFVGRRHDAYLLLEKDYFERKIATYALLTLQESYFSLDFLLAIYDLLTNNHENFAYYLYLQYCTRAPKIVAAAHHLYPSLCLHKLQLKIKLHLFQRDWDYRLFISY